jgi:hypothetical protein
VQGVNGPAPSTIGLNSLIDVRAGTLLVNGGVTGTGGITASISGILGGNASIEGPVAATAGAKISPGGLAVGQQIGVLTTGPLTLSTGSSLRIEITDSITYDALTVNGAVILGNATLELALVNLSANPGAIFYILNNTGLDPIGGTFNGLADDALFNGPGLTQFQISYDAIFGGGFNGGNDVAITLVTVPEPGSLVVLVSGLGMLLGMQRLRRRSN